MQSQTRLHSRGASNPASIDPGTYFHSPAHYAVARKDHAGLRKIILGLPKLAPVASVNTENDSIMEEAKAEALSAVIDNRDVPGSETPLHLAVRLGDATATEILMSAGADCSLQNENGWSSLQEAIGTRQDAIARIIVKHYQPLGWAKWCRRLPRIVATMNRMRDFYMEVSFNFESSVIPLIARAAPSDTYRIWKRGPNFRTDMTLSGFDGFKIQRSGQSFLFLGEGSQDERLPAGSLCVFDHKTKEISNALDGADRELTDREVAQEVSLMAQTNLYRPGIDVTQAILVPQLSWIWQEKVEIVNGWKAKVYEMQNVMLSVKSRQVPGAMSDEEFFQSLPNLDGGEDGTGEDLVDLISGKEKKQHADKASTSKIRHQDAGKQKAKMQDTKAGEVVVSPSAPASVTVDDRKGWFGRNRRSVHQEPTTKPAPPRKSFSGEMKRSDYLDDEEEEQAQNKQSRFQRGRRSIDTQRPTERELEEASMHVNEKKNRIKSRARPTSDGSKETEFKKGLRPVLWLTPDFPLKIEELLPLLDILANKVKAIRRLRELLTTKLPQGTFPVKIAFPVIPTIRVVITFSKFEEVQSNEDFRTLSSGPRSPNPDDLFGSAWLSWIKGPVAKPTEPHPEDEGDPFVIPRDYKWKKPAAQKGKKVAAKK
ncbi:hypothetical protein GOP47_0005839 [Adiantum capillus-veneris]|uniref:Ankyrin repeat domain-containing protein n=1 Tax=Adiantum capillus-veneris TaxID=13818 RepID=A0A9D4V6H8_ADICA|nr:hypothetical protein GOP47_0005839 [Adiantum capillus-veneris]